MQVRLQDLQKTSTFIINDKACMMTGILKKNLASPITLCMMFNIVFLLKELKLFRQYFLPALVQCIRLHVHLWQKHIRTFPFTSPYLL